MREGHSRIRCGGQSSFVSKVMMWSSILLVVAAVTILVSACGNGDGESLQTLLVVWNSSEDIDGAGADEDIFFSRSTDNGATWSAVQYLNNNAATDDAGSGFDYFPQAMTDGKGTWVAVWESRTDLDGADTDNDIFFARSTDDGMSWSAPRLIDSSATSDTDLGWDYQPVVMTDGDGTWVVVWWSYEDFDGSGSDTDIFFSRSTDNGASWSSSQLIDSLAASDGNEDRHPALMTDGNGVWIVVWASSETFHDASTDRDIFISRSADNGETWSASQLLHSSADSDTGSDNRPALMTDGSGIWMTVWFSTEDLGGAGTDRDIFLSRSTNNGVDWSAPQLLNSNATLDETTESDWKPHIMTDGEGNWVTVWNYQQNNTIDIDVAFSRSTDNGVNWSSQQMLNHNAAANTGSNEWEGNDNRPMVLYSGDVWVAAWQSREDVGGVDTDSDIFFSRSTDSGASWSNSQALNSNAATDFGDDRFGDED